MYRIQCECGKPLNVAFGDFNKVGRCPWCSRVFTIPAPVALTTGKLRCQCGLVMDYEYQDAGLLCECRQCKAILKIPGGTADSMSSELDREIAAKRAVAEAFRIRQHKSSSPPLNPVFESLGEFHHTRRPIVLDDYERFGIERMIAGIALLLIACVTFSVIAMWAQGMLSIPNQWLPQQLSSMEVEQTAPTQFPEDEQKVIPTAPLEQPRIQPEVIETPSRWVHIGEIPPSISPSRPAGIGTSFDSTLLSDSELESLANQIVGAVNANNSRDLTELMAPEVIGNYLFQHAELPPEQRFQLGAEAIALYANHPRISEQLPDAQAFPAIRMGQSMVPMIRVCNNSRQGSGKLTMGPSQLTNRPTLTPSPEMKRATEELVKEYDRLRQALDAKLPSRFGGRTMVESSGTINFQRTPLNDLLDHPAVYFAVIATRSRSGRPVLLDLACVNYDLCLLDATWNAIDRDKRKKSFQCSRPQKQTEKYFNAFRESVGETAVKDIFMINSAFDQIRTYEREAISISSYPEESRMADAGPEDCLNALEVLESLFPNDMHNFMLQCLTSRDAKFDKEARLLLDRLIEMKYSNVHFCDDWMNTCRRSGDAELASQIIDALKANCLR